VLITEEQMAIAAQLHEVVAEKSAEEKQSAKDASQVHNDYIRIPVVNLLSNPCC